MMITNEKPVSASADELPKALTAFVHARISSMSGKELRTWKRDSKKIMRKARNSAVAPLSAHETLRSGRESL
jgi:hypothetical protein